MKRVSILPLLTKLESTSSTKVIFFVVNQCGFIDILQAALHYSSSSERTRHLCPTQAPNTA